MVKYDAGKMELYLEIICVEKTRDRERIPLRDSPSHFNKNPHYPSILRSSHLTALFTSFPISSPGSQAESNLGVEWEHVTAFSPNNTDPPGPHVFSTQQSAGILME